MKKSKFAKAHTPGIVTTALELRDAGASSQEPA
jgi:hypothetical protein